MGGVMEICNQANLEPGIKQHQNEELIQSYKEISREEVVSQDLLADLEQLEKTEAFSQFKENKVFMKHKEKEEYYLGEWSDGIKKGRGLSFRQGEYLYYGSFGKAPRDNGYLKLYKQQLIVEGQFRAGQPEGECTIRDFNNKFTYKGLISEQKPTSGIFSVYNSADSQLSYTVKLEDYPQNNAIIQYENGSKYEGKVNTSTLMPEGEGKASYSNGTQYEGGWKNSLYHGRGRFSWPDGSFYEGEYDAGIKNGKGVYRYKSGKIYEGDWLNGKQAGAGVLYSSDKVALKSGFWENGVYIGQAAQLEQKEEIDEKKEKENEKLAEKEKIEEIKDSEHAYKQEREQHNGMKEAKEDEEEERESSY